MRSKIEKAKAKLMLEKNLSFWAYLSLFLKEKADKSMPYPAATDGEFLYYNPDEIEKYPTEEVMTIIAHEIFHVAFGHIWRRGGRDKDKWNIAADLVTNAHLAEAGFLMPKGVPINRDFINYSVEEAYEMIHDQIKMKTLDDHSLWDKISEKAKELEDLWKRRVAQAAQLCRMQGKSLGNLEELIKDLLEPKLSWRDLLRNFVTSSVKSDYSWFPPSKKYLYLNLCLPSIHGEAIEIVFAIDTSGSMSTDDIKCALSELKGICDQFQNYAIHLFQCDYGIQDYILLTPYDFQFPNKIKGRGGTSFKPVFQEVVQRGIKPQCLIYFTDLYGEFPEEVPEYPVMWLSCSDITDAPFGVVIKYTRGEK